MRPNLLLVATAAASLLALSACDKARPLAVPADSTRGCLTCHGGQDNQTGAPPWSLPRNAAGDVVFGGAQFTNQDATTSIEVGAHTRHLARGVSCGACHVVPAAIQAPNHNTGKRASVTFKELAAAGNVVPSAWLPAVHTCTNYCHGSSLSHGGTNHAPDWLGGAAAAACGTCHFAAGVTPPAQHPSGPGAGGAFPDTKACATCHPDTVSALDGTINVGGGKHVNGQLDGGGGHSAGWYDPANPPGAHGPAANGGLQPCTACHGTDFNGGTSGVSCNACHATAGHPSWQTECTFCHGAPTRAPDTTFPSVGSGTVVRANLAAPPVGSQGETNTTAYAVGAHEAHVAAGPFGRASQCSECHGPTLPTDTAHVNGTVALGWGVTAANAITPTPAAGNQPRWSDTTLPPNGANCTNFCHGATLDGGTHTSPKWNEGAGGAFCGSCHGLPLPYTARGGWHVPRSDCGTCHPGYTIGSVNVADHVFVGAGPQGLTCSSCHGSAANAAPPSDIGGATSGGNAIGAHQKHVAGVTLHQGSFACTECHPDNTGNLRHANGQVNVLWGATAAAGGYAATPANGGYTPGALFPACTNYCHLPRTNDTAAGLVKAPTWLATGTIVCGSCHGLPPVTPSHPVNAAACSTCHDGYADAPGPASTASAVSLANHLNGVINVKSMACTDCHGTLGRASVAGADPLQPVAPPAAASNVLAVGAHLAHVNQGDTAAPGPLSAPLACLNCHTGLIPATAPHNYPSNPVAFGNLAVAAGATPGPYAQATQTCSNTYCHGQFAGGRVGNGITWNPIGKLGCSACHGQSVAGPQPTYPHPQNVACASCHAGYTSTTVTAATHVDGLLQKTTSGCTSCHGELGAPSVTLTANTVKAAPGATGSGTNSVDTTGATTGTAVGAHRAHLVGTGGTPRWRSAAIACTECHALPPSNLDTTHATGAGTGGALATLTFGPLASDTAFEVKAAAYAQPTCSSVYCHDPKSSDTAASQANAPAWNGGSTAAQCGSCHGLPPVTAAHPTGVTECGSCHPGYITTGLPTSASTIAAVNALAHLNGQLDGGGDCTTCHATAQPMAAGGTRRAIVPEFAQAWSHKRSAGGVVTKWDCVVCHMEGDAATGNPSAVHKDGVINLRDPDTGANIKGVTFTAASGASPGSYAPTATDVTFTEFSRNLAVTLEADPAAATLQAIMINQCLKCHDADGAMSASARVPVSVMPDSSSAKPFGTTIAGAAYVGSGVTANGILGGVVDVNESFKTTNSSYHPVTGKQNNSYASGNRMVAPWVNTKTAGSTTAWGPLISCWDCHAPPAATGLQNFTVTAHGVAAANYLRGTPAIFGAPVATTNEATLCKVCHAGYNTNTGSNHGTGSAFTSSTDSGMTNYLRYACNYCHSSFISTTATAARPVRAQDVHGVNVLPTAGTKSGRWSGASTGTPPQVDARPYAFIRNTTTLANSQPSRIGGSTYTASCSTPTTRYSTCSNGMGSYTAGGTY